MVLCLTACTGATEPSASHPASADAVQSYPTRVAESELVFDDLPVGLEQVAGIGWCDFDRDGAEEEYKIMVQMEEDGMGIYRVSIGGSVVTGDAFYMEEKPYLASLDGENVQLVLFDRGVSDDPMMHIFGWNGTSVYKAGTLYTAPQDVRLENGVVIAPERWDVLQNSWFALHYELEGENIVRQKDPDRWYDYIGQDEIVTAQQVKLFTEDDLTNTDAFTVPMGEPVRITGVALDREIENPIEGDMPMYWVRVEYTAAKKTGYLLANGYQARQAGMAPVFVDELFENLIHAG